MAPALIVTFVAAWTGIDVVTARRQRKTPVMNLLVVTFTGVSLLSIVITSLVSIL
jgi:hypothetical protein